MQLGLLHTELCEHGRAIEELRKVIALVPDDADALCMLGAVLSDCRRFDEATAVLDRALKLRPDFSVPHFNLGLIHFEHGDFAAAQRAFDQTMALIRGAGWNDDPVGRLGRDPQPPYADQEMGVNTVKLRHDCEQLDYLLERGRLPAQYGAVRDDYRSLLAELGGDDTAGRVTAFDRQRHPLVARTFKRPFHIAPEPASSGALLNPDLDYGEIEQRYLSGQPQLTVVDGLLKPAALETLRQFCLESTIWHDVKAGYLGAYFQEGFSSEVLLRLAWELRERMPHVFHNLPLQMMWGFKYDHRYSGINTHADAAAVNVNFWITPDKANLDPATGGLLVYPHDAPQDWGFNKFNIDVKSMDAYLESVGSVPVRVPYRANRAVIFDSDLYHASDSPRFREGYLNRRINITLLYGLRGA